MTRIPQGFHASSGIRLSAALLVFAALLSGCGDIYLDAPRGAQVNLMPAKKPAQIRDEQVVWFKWWGNEPFHEPETHAATIIERYHLTEARIRMVNTFADGFISFFSGPVGFPRRTLVVEGNPGPTAAATPTPKE
ncbi:hypothetical protein EWI61_08350 [Methylolobus aquaticus]|uniref:hypothetical protein n=1 Tax=Methylotetracoccus oryzae TaxID=1919059 RepID=UPI001021C516|nr:hypothetical protein [Methylotetracoccus oryzae]RYU59633.1 hypothetical protein EWI61_08350 [Methylolobus aquaticus]